MYVKPSFHTTCVGDPPPSTDGRDYHLMFPQLTKWRLTEALYGILKLWISDNVLVVVKQDINERGLQNMKLNRNYTCMSELLYICHQILGEGVKPDLA